MIKMQKEFDGQWIVWDTTTQKTATIIRIDDYFMGKKLPSRYRVDYIGKTVATMLDKFSEAKTIASRQVRKIVETL